MSTLGILLYGVSPDEGYTTTISSGSTIYTGVKRIDLLQGTTSLNDVTFHNRKGSLGGDPVSVDIPLTKKIVGNTGAQVTPAQNTIFKFAIAGLGTNHPPMPAEPTIEYDPSVDMQKNFGITFDI